jgi:hypothetical protein
MMPLQLLCDAPAVPQCVSCSAPWQQIDPCQPVSKAALSSYFGAIIDGIVEGVDADVDTQHIRMMDFDQRIPAGWKL